MKKVIIIGAGIAGLSAGVYARQSGFDTTIYEAHSIPGGASTSWSRKGYLFEGGMHWLTGSSEKTALNRIWREVGALNDETGIYNRDPFFIYEQEGQRVCLYRDLKKLQAHLLQVSPEDAKEIRTLCKDIRKFEKMDMPVTDIKGVKVKNKSSVSVFSMLSMIPAFLRTPFYSAQTAGEYAMRYKSPVLQEMFKNVVGEEGSAMELVFTLSTLASGDGGYPFHGSLGMARRMADRFTALGEQIRYDAPVERVRVTDGAATGVVTDGKEVAADAVIVTQDTLAAIDRLFDPPIKEPWAQRMRQETVPMLNTFVCLGVKADLSELPENIIFTLPSPVSCCGQEIHRIGLNNYASYKGYAPEGCTALTSAVMGDSYEWWKGRKEDGTYEAEKEKLAKAFADALAFKYPQTKGKVEVWDVATPLTYERYLHSFKGSWMSVMGKGEGMKGYPSKPESISRLYFAGQRLMLPGGLPVAVETGRKAVQYLCLDTGTVFQGFSSCANLSKALE